tara:strand:- start:297 stop:494 length:198 start_codon:yes stop_codon:yes gene_type:complete
MTTIESKSGNKAVNIKKSNNGYGGFEYVCSYVQVYTNDQRHEDLIEQTEFDTELKAIKWANRQLK